MLDIKLIRENPARIREAMALRGADWEVDAFLATDSKRRARITEIEGLQAQRNELSRQIGLRMKEGAHAAAQELKDEVAHLKAAIAAHEDERRSLDARVAELLATAPNLPDASVPPGADETENVELKKWGAPRSFDFTPQAHWDLGPALGIVDFERAVKLADSRFVLLGGRGAQLERALINFMLDMHADAGFKEWWPPTLANSETLFGTGQLPKFENDLYKTQTTSDANELEGGVTANKLYLTPTAEVTLTNIHRGEVLDAASLPLYYTAYTSCFREEAGSAGRDTRGMIRVHQFDKVELVKFTTPETSLAELESMTRQGEAVLEALELPYRRLALCTGDLGFGASKTYDLEVWLPSYHDYKEISSCSDCGDFQARRAKIKYRDPQHFKGTRFLHTLNGSGLAVGRTFAALIENYQQADGSVTIPEVLRPYLRGLKAIVP